MTTSDDRIKEIVEFYLDNDEKTTLETFNVSSESLNRYKRNYKNIFTENAYESKKVIKDIVNKYTPEELRAISSGGRIVPGQAKVPIIDFSGQRIRFAHITDTHIGSIFFKEKFYEEAIKECKKEGVEFICHTGDVTEGMSNRPGHVYELSQIGYDNQKNYAVEVLSKWDKKYYFIDGNHDRWFIKNSGAKIVKDICKELNDAEFLGHDLGIMALKDKATIQLWHGEDGSSYATSYRVQKVIESITGGEKPNIWLGGHTHKQCYIFDRHVHAFSGGALSIQSSWMKSKRLANHTGFWIIDAYVNKNSISKCVGAWYPYYS